MAHTGYFYGAGACGALAAGVTVAMIALMNRLSKVWIIILSLALSILVMAMIALVIVGSHLMESLHNDGNACAEGSGYAAGCPILNAAFVFGGFAMMLNIRLCYSTAPYALMRFRLPENLFSVFVRRMATSLELSCLPAFVIADGIENGAKLAVETDIFGKTYTYKKDGDAKEATDNKELKRNTVVYPSIAVQWLNFITYLILLLVYVPGDQGHLTAFYFVIAVSGFVFGLSNVLTFAIDDNYLPIYIAGENSFPVLTSLIHYLSSLMFGNRRKWNSDFLMVYIDLVVAILLSLLSAVMWTLGYVSKHPTEDDALKSKATEVVKAIIQGLNGKVDKLATAVVAKVEQALKSAQAQQDPVNLDLTETIQAVLNAANGLQGQVQSVKEALEKHLEITNIQGGVDKSAVQAAIQNLQSKKQAAIAAVKGALGGPSANDTAKIEDKDLTAPATKALKTVKLEAQAGAVKTNLKSGGSGKTQINIGDSITQALTKLEQNKPGTTTGEKEPKPEAVQDVQSALSQGTAKTQFTSLWHIKGTDGYSSLDSAHWYIMFPFLMVLIGMGLVYCIYPAIAPGMIVPFYLVDKIEMVLLIATIFPALYVAIARSGKLIPGFGGFFNPVSPTCNWGAKNELPWIPGVPLGQGYHWHLTDLVIPTMIILAYLFIYSLHYRDSSVARSIINQPKMSTCLTILFYMCHEISLAVGFPGIFGGNGGGSILALTAQLMGAFLMCLLAPYSEGYIIEYKRHDPSNWPTAGMTRWNALRYWTKMASKNCNKNLAALFTKDLRRDLLLCIERNELI
ncbi:Tpr family protein [Theileria parva strain Muguga]|uniref:Uncharacterized protein n=3 Tax=Theileria parva TaxID=5875 RepID=Q4MZ74_THEPA|nr:uncharacterized protein TpMuguga_03g00617 [Theileria parva strain Muguga]EAN30458.1 Tpr family protein [Theileria parva strain Muguga]|eukprot:XP_762741.1 hypothetical protein [Theileria parva strain Muguga]